MEFAKLRCAVVPTIRNISGVMAEVAQIQLKLPIVCNLNQPAHLPHELRLAIRRESHHLVFVAVMGEANELCDRRKKDPERVREINAVLNFYPVSMAESE